MGFGLWGFGVKGFKGKANQVTGRGGIVVGVELIE